MRTIKIEKITLNVGTGKEQLQLDRGVALLKAITGREPIKTVTQKRIPGWGLRPGLPVGVKVTVRGKEAEKLLLRLLDAKEFTLPKSCFDSNGNVSFGINEYIDIKDAKYDPKIGMMGLQVTITLQRPGYRVKLRKLKKSKVGSNHKITKNDAIDYLKEKFNVKIKEEVLENDDE